MSLGDDLLCVNRFPGPYSYFRKGNTCTVTNQPCALWFEGQSGNVIHNNCGQCVIALAKFLEYQARPQDAQPLSRDKFCMNCGTRMTGMAECPKCGKKA